MHRFGARPKTDRWFMAVVLFCWLWMNVWIATRYEPWRDIAQCWMIARQLSFSQMMAQLKYEGHPCLWFVLLFPMAKLGLPFDSIFVLSFGLMLAALWLFLRVTTLTRLEKLVVVFSGTGMYYLPVEARSYALIPLLLLLLYVAYPKRFTHPLRYAAVLFLLCQTHVLLCGLVGVLMLQWGIGALREWRTNPGGRRGLVGALTTMAGGVAFLFWQLHGSVTTNESVSFSAVTGFADLRHLFFDALSTGSEYLIGIQLYETGNTVWWLVTAPLLVAIVVLCVFWLRRAPKSGTVMLGASLWQWSLHALLYGIHMHHMLTFLWMLLFCMLLERDELAQRAPARRGPANAQLARAITAFVLIICLLTSVPTYAFIRKQCASYGINSESVAAAEYINTQLPADALVLVDSEDQASPVAAQCPEGKLYNPIRHNYHIFSLHDSYTSGWCAFGDLDAEVNSLRASGVTGALYLLGDLDASDDAQAMSDRSENKLVEVTRFVSTGAYEQYILYRIVEAES